MSLPKSQLQLISTADVVFSHFSSNSCFIPTDESGTANHWLSLMQGSRAQGSTAGAQDTVDGRNTQITRTQACRWTRSTRNLLKNKPALLTLGQDQPYQLWAWQPAQASLQHSAELLPRAAGGAPAHPLQSLRPPPGCRVWHGQTQQTQLSWIRSCMKTPRWLHPVLCVVLSQHIKDASP